MAAHAGKDFALISLNGSFIENWAAALRQPNYSPVSNSDGDLGKRKSIDKSWPCCCHSGLA
jgi:hypothetical protein